MGLSSTLAEVSEKGNILNSPQSSQCAAACSHAAEEVETYRER